MKKHTIRNNTIDAIIPISIAFLLIIGIFISIVQVQQPQKKDSSAQIALKNCTVDVSKLTLTAIEKQMFDTINTYRQQQGLQPLNYDQNLQRGAAWMSQDMHDHKNLNHTDTLSRDVGARLKDCGLVNESSWGENISEGYQTVQAAFDGWKNSPGHNANMLGNFTHMGISENNTYWTLDLANLNNGNTQPPPVSGQSTPPVSLNPSEQSQLTPTPLVTAVPNTLPDLIVSDLVIAPNAGTDACGPLGILATIKNQGTRDVTGAITVKINSGVATFGNGLSAGGTKTVWLQNIASSGQNTATVDPNNQIVESNESNNQLSKTLTAPTKPPSCPTAASLPTYAVGQPSSIDSLTPTNLPTPTEYPGFVVNPNDTQVLVSVKYPGVGINGNPSPRHLSRKVTITVYNLNNEQAFVGQGFLTYDNDDLFRGIIHLGKVSNDSYYIKVSGDHTLQELVMPQFQYISNSRLNVLSPIVFVTGELTGDNQLTIADYNTALTCFQDKKCGVKPVTDENQDGLVDVYDAIDFNDDGKVDVVDYNFFLHNFKEFRGD